jgi:hypothetical protein
MRRTRLAAPGKILPSWERGPQGRLKRARLIVAAKSRAELVAHHAMLRGADPIEAARRYDILTAVEAHRRAWVAAGYPPLPRRPEHETIDSLRRRRTT